MKPFPEHIARHVAVMTASDSRMQAIVEHFRKSLTEQREANDELRGEELLNGQGRAQELRDILREIEAAQGGA